MMDFFELPVEYKGNEILFPAALLPIGFTHKIKVTVDGTDIFFEPDEERNYRAITAETDFGGKEQLNRPLLEAICITLDHLFGNGS